MQTIDTRTLIASGRSVPLPAVLHWQITGGSQLHSLELLRIFRVVPERRVVALARWNGRVVVAKLFFARGRWMQHLERESKGIAKIAAAGIATPALLETGVSSDGGTGVLLLHYLENSESVGRRWESAEDEEKDALLRRVVTLVAQCHTQGMLQKDIHLDNFLMQGEALYLLDAAAVEQHVPEHHGKSHNEFLSDYRQDFHKSIHNPFSNPFNSPFNSPFNNTGLDTVRSLQNLAMFFAQFPVSNDASVAALYEYYRTQRPLADISTDLVMFFALLRQNRQARLRVVLDKLYRETSAHICQQQWNRFVMFSRELDSPELQDFIAAPDDFIAHGRMLKKGNTATVAVVRIGSTDYVVKRYNIKNFWHGLSRLFRPSRAWVCWSNAHMLEMLGIATAKPMLLMERRFGRLRREAYFLCEFVRGEDALHFLEKQPITSAAWTRALEQFRKLFLIMAEYGIVHGDMKATNFISTDEALIVLDLDAMRQENDTQHFNAALRKDLQRFAANWQGHPEIALHVLAMVERLMVEQLEHTFKGS